jgi:DNA-binding PadR family transcriptional regulator
MENLTRTVPARMADKPEDGAETSGTEVRRTRWRVILGIALIRAGQAGGVRSLKARLPFYRRAIYDDRVAGSRRSEGDDGHSSAGALGTFGRYAGPATLILASLADGPKHGYALTKDIEQFAGLRLAPGTLYEALSRLEGQGLIEALASQGRRRPYQLTAVGATALRAHLDDQRRVAEVGLGRLARSWGTA